MRSFPERACVFSPTQKRTAATSLVAWTALSCHRLDDADPVTGWVMLTDLGDRLRTSRLGSTIVSRLCAGVASGRLLLYHMRALEVCELDEATTTPVGGPHACRRACWYASVMRKQAGSIRLLS